MGLGGKLTCGSLRSKSQLPACRYEELGKREAGEWGLGDSQAFPEGKSEQRRACTAVTHARASYVHRTGPFQRRLKSPPHCGFWWKRRARLRSQNMKERALKSSGLPEPVTLIRTPFPLQPRASLQLLPFFLKSPLLLVSPS